MQRSHNGEVPGTDHGNGRDVDVLLLDGGYASPELRHTHGQRTEKERRKIRSHNGVLSMRAPGNGGGNVADIILLGVTLSDRGDGRTPCVRLLANDMIPSYHIQYAYKWRTQIHTYASL